MSARFDAVVMVDWSAAEDRGPTPKKDAIWTARAEGGAVQTRYHRSHADIESWLIALLEADVAAGRRALVGFDFPFGYPRGFARRLTGDDDPLAVWDWFAARLPGGDRFVLAGEINALFPGVGPFWFNGTAADVANLPRKGRDRADFGLPERRAVEQRARGAFSCWQMGGAGAVGGQAMTGMACLSRLRRRLGDRLAVWPFQPPTAPVVFVEVWPSLIAAVVRDAMAGAADAVKDEWQVRILAGAVAALAPDALDAMLDAQAAEEGWILGVGHEAALAAAARAALAKAPPRLRDDCFALPPGVAWTPVDAALASLRAGMVCVCDAETVELSQADGRILAGPARALRAHPPAANAAVDGYAFAHAAMGQGALALLDGRAAAGAPFAAAVPPGSALRILTGALIPPGCDTVAMQEDVAPDAGRIRFEPRLKRGANVRPAGENLATGAVAAPAGRRLTPADLAQLAAGGHGALSVRRRLRVGVLSTGDEVVAPGAVAAAGAVHDSNRPMLMAMLARWGHAAVDLGIAPDDAAAVRAALDQGAARCDAVLASGGASAGDEDHMSRLLRAERALNVWRVAMKPGRPLAMGLWRGAPVFGLPGNPVAAFVCALVFAHPALGVMAGGDWAEPAALRLPAAFARRRKPGRRDYLRARLTPDGRVEAFASDGSGLIGGLAWAQGLAVLSEAGEDVAPGDPVDYLPFAAFGL